MEKTLRKVHVVEKQIFARHADSRLDGNPVPLGGVKEKLLAAYRQGITRILLPRENEKDLEKIDPDILAKFDIRPLDDVEAALDAVLVKEPTQLAG